MLPVVVLVACASVPPEPDEHGYRWVRDAPSIPRDAWRYHYVEPAEIWLRCTPASVACAVRLSKGRVSRCDIYLPGTAGERRLEFLRAHEEQHCQGWSHPPEAVARR